MVRSRRRKGLAGLVGTPMGGPGGQPRADGQRATPAKYNDQMCPICYSVARQPCRQVLSPPGAVTLRLGKPITTMHPERTGTSSPEKPTEPRSKSRPTATDASTASPRPTDQVRAEPTGFVPKNQRNVTRDEHGRLRTHGWSRDNTDAIPRPH